MSEDTTSPDLGGVLDVEEIIAEARRPERSAYVCTRGDLNAEFDRLEQQLQQAQEDNRGGDGSLATSGAAGLARRIEELRTQMREHVREFRFRAMSQPEWWEFDAPRREKQKLPDDHLVKMVARCAVAPVMTEDQVRRLFAVLSQSQMDALVGAAWDANNASVDVPKSWLSSRVLQPPDSV